MKPTFFDLLAGMQKNQNYVEMAVDAPGDDGIPIRVCSVDGKMHTFMVSDFVNVKLKKTVTHVQHQDKDESLT